jgi:hypothetical protein
VKLTILSDLVGTPGEEYVPAEGINVEALIEGGFIKQEKTTKEKSED